MKDKAKTGSDPLPVFLLFLGYREEISQIVILAAVRDGFEIFGIPSVGNAHACDMRPIRHSHRLLFVDDAVVRKLIECLLCKFLLVLIITLLVWLFKKAGEHVN